MPRSTLNYIQSNERGDHVNWAPLFLFYNPWNNGISFRLWAIKTPGKIFMNTNSLEHCTWRIYVYTKGVLYGADCTCMELYKRLARPGPPGCQFISILLTRGIGTHKHLPTLLPFCIKRLWLEIFYFKFLPRPSSPGPLTTNSIVLSIASIGIEDNAACIGIPASCISVRYGAFRYGTGSFYSGTGLVLPSGFCSFTGLTWSRTVRHFGIQKSCCCWWWKGYPVHVQTANSGKWYTLHVHRHLQMVLFLLFVNAGMPEKS